MYSMLQFAAWLILALSQTWINGTKSGAPVVDPLVRDRNRISSLSSSPARSPGSWNPSIRVLIIRIVRKGFLEEEGGGKRRRELVRMRRLFLLVTVLAGLLYVGRQYGREIGRLSGASTGTVSRTVKPVRDVAPGKSLEIFDGCGVEGDARSIGVRALDRLKNRYTQPSPEQIDSRITLAAVLAPGNDISRWKLNEGAKIVGYVSEVKRGGIEVANCRARDDADRDTHIELVLDPMHSDSSARMIVEVTPRWRYIMRERGTDWSTRGLRDQFLGRWVKVDGWMLFDAEHQRESENTAPGRLENWRATAWEIHPVTSIEVASRVR